MNFIKRKLRERRSKKSLADLQRRLGEMKKNRVAGCGQIYDANDEQPLINKLDAVFDKHHGW